MRLDKPNRIPALALWLGILGLVPFVATAGLSYLSKPVDPTIAVQALIAYGAVILSFLGGVHWGVALIRGQTRGASSQTYWYVLSVVPSLIAWCALMMPPVTGLLTLTVSFFAMAVVDAYAARMDQAPIWYPRLRMWLSAIVILSLLAVAWGQS